MYKQMKGAYSEGRRYFTDPIHLVPHANLWRQNVVKLVVILIVKVGWMC